MDHAGDATSIILHRATTCARSLQLSAWVTIWFQASQGVCPSTNTEGCQQHFISLRMLQKPSKQQHTGRGRLLHSPSFKSHARQIDMQVCTIKLTYSLVDCSAMPAAPAR
eukprot:GHUV01055854.1.p1 GENE.GHUV01055854.1~~GHUV01055854.1.p1  ORF type:complete len:110 (+),score=24.99 GHUV01055854.1:28-357(+)